MNRNYALTIRLVIYSLFCMFLLGNDVFSIDAYGKDEIEVTGPDSEGTYTYTYKSGKFYTNVKNKEVADIAFFEWDSNLSVSIMKNGTQISFNSGDILYIGGNYVAFIYDKASGDFTTFEFTIDNDLTYSSAISSTDTGDSSGPNSSGQGLDILNEVDFMTEFGDLGIGEYDEDKVGRLNLTYSYSAEENLLVYSGAKRPIFKTNIPNNCYVNASKGAIVRSVNNQLIYVYKDGEMLFQSGDKIYTEPGYYDVVSFVMNPAEEDISDEERIEGSLIYEAHFSFTIVPDIYNNIGVFSTPEGFNISSLSYNGVGVSIEDEKYYFLDKDGEYYVEYVSKDNCLTYDFSFVKDTTAPVITFNKDIKRNIIEDELSYTVDDSEAEVLVYLNNNPVKFTPGIVSTDAGWYRFIATDKAGNTRSYSVYLDVSYRFFSKGMIISIIILSIAFVIYVLNVRRGEYRVDEWNDAENNDAEK